METIAIEIFLMKKRKRKNSMDKVVIEIFLKKKNQITKRFKNGGKELK